MRRLIVFTLVCAMALSFCGFAEGGANYSDEMKITNQPDLSPADGADSVERDGDHQASPYFNQLDFFNMKITDSLTLLSGFKTMQQTSEWSCGVTSVMMILNWYGKLADYTEGKLCLLRDNGNKAAATSLKQAVQMFEGVGGFDLYSRLDIKENPHEVFTLDFIQKTLKEGKPIMVGWNDWGGHWQVIIGYDTMGTKDVTQDDVLIVADSYDTTDHNQDGYGVYPAERFLYNFSFYNFFPEEEINDMCFIVASPKAS